MFSKSLSVIFCLLYLSDVTHAAWGKKTAGKNAARGKASAAASKPKTWGKKPIKTWRNADVVDDVQQPEEEIQEPEKQSFDLSNPVNLLEMINSGKINLNDLVNSDEVIQHQKETGVIPTTTPAFTTPSPKHYDYFDECIGLKVNRHQLKAANTALFRSWNTKQLLKCYNMIKWSDRNACFNRLRENFNILAPVWKIRAVVRGCKDKVYSVVEIQAERAEIKKALGEIEGDI